MVTAVVAKQAHDNNPCLLSSFNVQSNGQQLRLLFCPAVTGHLYMESGIVCSAQFPARYFFVSLPGAGTGRTWVLVVVLTKLCLNDAFDILSNSTIVRSQETKSEAAPILLCT